MFTVCVADPCCRETHSTEYKSLCLHAVGQLPFRPSHQMTVLAGMCGLAQGQLLHSSSRPQMAANRREQDGGGPRCHCPAAWTRRWLQQRIVAAGLSRTQGSRGARLLAAVPLLRPALTLAACFLQAASTRGSLRTRIIENVVQLTSVATETTAPGAADDGALVMFGRTAGLPSGLSRYGGLKIWPSGWFCLRAGHGFG